MDMRDEDSVSRIVNLFIAYHSLFRKHRLRWVIDENTKTSVRPITSGVLPNSFRTRLESDLSFGYHQLEQDFKSLISHFLKLSEAIKVLYVAPNAGKKVILLTPVYLVVGRTMKRKKEKDRIKGDAKGIKVGIVRLPLASTRYIEQVDCVTW